MTDRNKWPDAQIALVFIRPIRGLSEEVQTRMIDKAVKQLGIRHEIYKAPIANDNADERGEVLRHCRGTEVVVVARLNVLGRPRSETGDKTASREFMLFVSKLHRKCKYILVLDDNLPSTPVNSSVTSDDKDWDEVLDRAINVVANSRSLTTEESKKLNVSRWAGQFRGVRDEWTNNPERAEEREAMGRIWRDPVYANAEQAFAAMPEEVRKQFKNSQMAGKILGKRNPSVVRGRPKGNQNE